jgi:glycosyltransferase involved in cell wall biosynthesis
VQCEVITYWYRYRADSAIRQAPSPDEVWQWVQHYVALHSAQSTQCDACKADIRLATSRAILRECMAMVNANAILRLPEVFAYCREHQVFTASAFPWRWRFLLQCCERGMLWPLRFSFYWIVCKRTCVRWWSVFRQRNVSVHEAKQSLRQFQLFVEPTEYILDLIEAVHGPRGVTCAFAYDRKTLASLGTTAFPVVEKFSWCKRIAYLWQALKHHDVVSIHSYTDSISVTLLILNLFWRRVFVFEVDSAWREPQRWFSRIAKRFWLEFWFRQSYVWGSAIGAQVHRDFFLKYGLPKERLSERPNVVKNARYARVMPPIPTEAFRFGYVGRLVHHKGVHMLIEAFREVVRIYPKATLAIVGDGPEREVLQSQTADLPQVTFYGAVYGAQKVALQHQMDALCLVSTYEPWGLVVNEALAGGTPCIVTQCCGCAEPLIKAPRAGIVVPENDIPALITAMCSFIQNPLETAAMGQRGANFLHATWNYTRYAHHLDTWLINLRQKVIR